MYDNLWLKCQCSFVYIWYDGNESKVAYIYDRFLIHGRSYIQATSFVTKYSRMHQVKFVEDSL